MTAVGGAGAIAEGAVAGAAGGVIRSVEQRIRYTAKAWSETRLLMQ